MPRNARLTRRRCSGSVKNAAVSHGKPNDPRGGHAERRVFQLIKARQPVKWRKMLRERGRRLELHVEALGGGGSALPCYDCRVFLIKYLPEMKVECVRKGKKGGALVVEWKSRAANLPETDRSRGTRVFHAK